MSCKTVEFNDGGPLSFSLISTAMETFSFTWFWQMGCWLYLQKSATFSQQKQMIFTWSLAAFWKKYRWSELSKQTDGQKRSGLCCRRRFGGGVGELFLVAIGNCYKKHEFKLIATSHLFLVFVFIVCFYDNLKPTGHTKNITEIYVTYFVP